MQVALCHYLAAMHACAWPHVHYVVGGADHVFVMLDHEHAIAHVAQALQRADQAIVVALVQADAGFIEHIHHARKARADLRCQANALRFAAGECFGAALQREVAQAHIYQKAQARGNFAHDFFGNLGLGAAQLQVIEVLPGIGQCGVVDVVDGALLLAFAQHDVARIAPQAAACAGRAGRSLAVARQLFAHHGRIGFAVAPRHIGQHAFEGMLFLHGFARLRTAAKGVGKGDFLFARAVQDDVADGFGQVFKRCIHAEAIVLRQAFDEGEVVLVARVPAFDGAAGQAERGKGHDALGIKRIHHAQAIALGAGALRRVEREHARLQRRNAVAALRAGIAGVEKVLGTAVHFGHDGAAIGQAQRGLETFGQALAGVGPHFQAVDYHVDVVAVVFFQRGQVDGVQHLPVDAKAHIAQRLHVGERVGKFALALASDGRQQHDAGFFGQGQGGIHHLAHGLRLQGQTVIGAVRRACAGKQQAQIVVNFGDSTHGGARVVAGGFLLDADGGRQAFDPVDIGLVHDLQELPRIGRKAFHIAALALGIQGVKRQTGFARA